MTARRATFASALAYLPRYVLAGALAGALVGAAEAAWINLSTDVFDDRSILWWAPLAYALLFAPVGAVAGILIHLLQSIRKAQITSTAYAAAFAVCIIAGVITVGRWRLFTDLPRSVSANAVVVDGGVLVAAIVLGCLAYWIARRTRIVGQIPAVALVVIACAAASFIPLSHVSTMPLASTSPPNAPNVILVVIDTLRADHLSPYNPDVKYTPNFARFANESVVFTRGVAQSAWTKPSFGSIYTGRFPHDHSATDRVRPLPDDAVTLAELLRDAGYLTLGMSNSNPNNSMGMNFDQGYTYFEDLKPNAFLFGMPLSARGLALHRRLFEPIRKRVMPFVVHVRHFYEPADVVTDTALRWLDEKTAPERPLFLTVHYMDPHDPYLNGQRKGRGYVHHDFKDRPDRAQLVPELLRAYAGDIGFMDIHFGRFMDGLRERGFYDDTLIVVTADHGEEFLDHGDFSHGKTLYNEMIAVPLLIKLPANAGAGSVNEDLANHIDIAPTILSIAGLTTPESMAGQPLLAADGAFLNAHATHAFSETSIEEDDWTAVQTADSKFIVHGSEKQQEHTRELYNLAVDPKEKNNLIAANPPVAAELNTLLNVFVSGRGSEGVENLDQLAPGVQEQLRALGYID